MCSITCTEAAQPLHACYLLCISRHPAACAVRAAVLREVHEALCARGHALCGAVSSQAEQQMAQLLQQQPPGK